jgi:hypothetical protein
MTTPSSSDHIPTKQDIMHLFGTQPERRGSRRITFRCPADLARQLPPSGRGAQSAFIVEAIRAALRTLFPNNADVNPSPITAASIKQEG